MIQAVLFVNAKGEVIISRQYRDGFSKAVSDTFRAQVIASKEVPLPLPPRMHPSPFRRAPALFSSRRPPAHRHRALVPFFFRSALAQAGRWPLKVIGNTAFLYVKVGSMYAVAVASGNAQAALAFQFLHEVVKVLKNYFGDFTEESIRNNFVLIYELLDEVLDYGYPQNCSTDVLKLYITQEGDKSAAAAKKAQNQAVTIQATGAISWRKEGIKYRKNELFIDVVENCNLLVRLAQHRAPPCAHCTLCPSHSLSDAHRFCAHTGIEQGHHPPQRRLRQRPGQMLSLRHTRVQIRPQRQIALGQRGEGAYGEQ